MKNLTKFIAMLIAAASCYSSYTNIEQNIEKNIKKQNSTKQVTLQQSNLHIHEFSDFSPKEKSLLNHAAILLSQKYALGYDIFAFKLPSNVEKQGCAFPKLGSDNNEKIYFIELFGQETYNALEGRDAIAIKDLDFYENVVNEKKVWGSSYIKVLTPENAYTGDAIHEIAHTIFKRISSQEIVDRIFEIDIKSRAYEANVNLGEVVIKLSDNGTKVRESVYKKSEKLKHPGHPSFYSFLWCGAPMSEEVYDIKERCVSEQFSEILAYYLQGAIDENVGDKFLVEKLKLVKQALKPYEHNNK